MRKLLLDLIPAMKGKFRSSEDERTIAAFQKTHIDVQCMGENCINYVSKRPDNIVRDFKKFGVPSIYCDSHKCQSQKPKIKRPVRAENSLSNAMPSLARRLCKPYCPDDIGFKERSFYPFRCIHCESIIKIAPFSIKKKEYSDWAAFCLHKEECQKAKNLLKKKLTKERGSYAKLAKNGESFMELFPGVAAKQHQSCDCDLSTLKINSNERVTFSCDSCGSPVRIELGKVKGRNEFYCSNNEKCRNLKKLSTQKRDWQTRIIGKNSFADVNPYLAMEWERCISHPGVTADMVPANATVNVRWRCRANSAHVWVKNCDDRTNFPGCPFCTSNISDMQFRFASELEALLKVEVRHSKIYLISGNRVEIDISFEFGLRKFAIEIDGFRWHEKKFNNDEIKNKRLKADGWEIYRIRDYRLMTIGEPVDSFNYYVSSTAFYKEQWISVLSEIVERITTIRLLEYSDYIAEKKYQELKIFYNSKSVNNKNKKSVLNGELF